MSNTTSRVGVGGDNNNGNTNINTNGTRDRLGGGGGGGGGRRPMNNQQQQQQQQQQQPLLKNNQRGRRGGSGVGRGDGKFNRKGDRNSEHTSADVHDVTALSIRNMGASSRNKPSSSSSKAMDVSKRSRQRQLPKQVVETTPLLSMANVLCEQLPEPLKGFMKLLINGKPSPALLGYLSAAENSLIITSCGGLLVSCLLNVVLDRAPLSGKVPPDVILQTVAEGLAIVTSVVRYIILDFSHIQWKCSSFDLLLYTLEYEHYEDVAGVVLVRIIGRALELLTESPPDVSNTLENMFMLTNKVSENILCVLIPKLSHAASLHIYSFGRLFPEYVDVLIGFAIGDETSHSLAQIALSSFATLSPFWLSHCTLAFHLLYSFIDDVHDIVNFADVSVQQEKQINKRMCCFVAVAESVFIVYDEIPLSLNMHSDLCVHAFRTLSLVPPIISSVVSVVVVLQRLFRSNFSQHANTAVAALLRLLPTSINPVDILRPIMTIATAHPELVVPCLIGHESFCNLRFFRSTSAMMRDIFVSLCEDHLIIAFLVNEIIRSCTCGDEAIVAFNVITLATIVKNGKPTSNIDGKIFLTAKTTNRSVRREAVEAALILGELPSTLSSESDETLILCLVTVATLVARRVIDQAISTSCEYLAETVLHGDIFALPKSVNIGENASSLSVETLMARVPDFDTLMSSSTPTIRRIAAPLYGFSRLLSSSRNVDPILPLVDDAHYSTRIAWIFVDMLLSASYKAAPIALSTPQAILYAVLRSPSSNSFKPPDFLRLMHMLLQEGPSSFSNNEDRSLHQLLHTIQGCQRLSLWAQDALPSLDAVQSAHAIHVPISLWHVSAADTETVVRIVCQDRNLAWLWLIWEAARYAVNMRLTTSLGGPARTLELIEDHLRAAVVPPPGGARVPTQRRCWLMCAFAWSLDKSLFNAYAGCMSLSPVSVNTVAWFRKNRSTIIGWFNRMRFSLVRLALKAGDYAGAVYHGYSFLAEMSSPNNNDPEFERAALLVRAAFISMHETRALAGLSTWLKPYFPWAAPLAKMALGRLEASAIDYEALINTQDWCINRSVEATSAGKYQLSAEAATASLEDMLLCYRRTENWAALERWRVLLTNASDDTSLHSNVRRPDFGAVIASLSRWSVGGKSVHLEFVEAERLVLVNERKASERLLLDAPQCDTTNRDSIFRAIADIDIDIDIVTDDENSDTMDSLLTLFRLRPNNEDLRLRAASASRRSDNLRTADQLLQVGHPRSSGSFLLERASLNFALGSASDAVLSLRSLLSESRDVNDDSISSVDVTFRCRVLSTMAKWLQKRPELEEAAGITLADCLQQATSSDTPTAWYEYAHYLSSVARRSGGETASAALATAFFRFLQLGPFSTVSEVATTLRLIRLIVRSSGDTNSNGELIGALQSGVSSTPSAPWRSAIPQLFARLGHPSPFVRQQITSLISAVARDFPHLVIFPAVVGDKEDLLTAMPSRNTMVTQVAAMISGLKRLTVLWEEKWISTLNTLAPLMNRKLELLAGEVRRVQANASLSAEDRRVILEAKYSAELKPCSVMLRRTWSDTIGATGTMETPHEACFRELFGARLEVAMATLDKPSQFDSPQSLWAPLGTLLRNISRHARRHTSGSRTLDITSISPSLASLSDLAVPMPGISDVTIARFENDVLTLASKTKPKKLYLLGSDGRRYGYLFKGLEDLHLDERIMQFISVANSALAAELRAYTYAVVPLGPRIGLIQWVDGATPLLALYRHWQSREKCQLTRLPDLFYGKMIPALRAAGSGVEVSDRRSWPVDVVQKVFQELETETPKNLLSSELWCASVDSRTWWNALSSYTRSSATTAMLGYILGLGDRHLDNILVNVSSGHVVQIDYNICFDKGERLRVPETVPFRMTQNLRHALGPLGTDGVFRSVCEEVLRALRTNRETLMILLDAFVYDPLVDWTGNNKSDSREKLAMDADISVSLLTACLAEVKAPLERHSDELLGVVTSTMELVRRSVEGRTKIASAETNIDSIQLMLDALKILSVAENVTSLADLRVELAALQAERDAASLLIHHRLNGCRQRSSAHRAAMHVVCSPPVAFLASPIDVLLPVRSDGSLAATYTPIASIIHDTSIFANSPSNLLDRFHSAVENFVDAASMQHKHLTSITTALQTYASTVCGVSTDDFMQRDFCWMWVQTLEAELGDISSSFSVSDCLEVAVTERQLYDLISNQRAMAESAAESVAELCSIVNEDEILSFHFGEDSEDDNDALSSESVACECAALTLLHEIGIEWRSYNNTIAGGTQDSSDLDQDDDRDTVLMVATSARAFFTSDCVSRAVSAAAIVQALHSRIDCYPPELLSVDDNITHCTRALVDTASFIERLHSSHVILIISIIQCNEIVGPLVKGINELLVRLERDNNSEVLHELNLEWHAILEDAGPAFIALNDELVHLEVALISSPILALPRRVIAFLAFIEQCDSFASQWTYCYGLSDHGNAIAPSEDYSCELDSVVPLDIGEATGSNFLVSHVQSLVQGMNFTDVIEVATKARQNWLLAVSDVATQPANWSVEEAIEGAIASCLEKKSFEAKQLSMAHGALQNISIDATNCFVLGRRREATLGFRSVSEFLQLQLRRFQWINAELTAQHMLMGSTSVSRTPEIEPKRTTILLTLTNVLPQLSEALSATREADARLCRIEDTAAKRLSWSAGTRYELVAISTAFASAISARRMALAMSISLCNTIGSIVSPILNFEELRRVPLNLTAGAEATCLNDSTRTLVTKYERFSRESSGKEADVNLLQQLVGADTDIVTSVLVQERVLAVEGELAAAFDECTMLNEHYYSDLAKLQNTLSRMCSGPIHEFRSLADKTWVPALRNVAKVTGAFDKSPRARDIFFDANKLLDLHGTFCCNIDSIISASVSEDTVLSVTENVYESVIAFLVDFQGLLFGVVETSDSIVWEEEGSNDEEDIVVAAVDSDTVASANQQQERNLYAIQAWKRVKAKLEGRIDYNNEESISNGEQQRLTVVEQVEYVIKEATNTRNLSQMFEGWAAWC